MNFIQATSPETAKNHERITALGDYQDFNEAVLVDATTIFGRANDIRLHDQRSRSSVVFGLDNGRAEEMRKALVWYAENALIMPTVTSSMEIGEEDPEDQEVLDFFDSVKSEMQTHLPGSSAGPLVVIGGIERFIGATRAQELKTEAQKTASIELTALLDSPRKPVICGIATCKFKELSFQEMAIGPLSKFAINYATSDLASSPDGGFELLPSAKGRARSTSAVEV